MRINQYVAAASGLSRRAADNAIASGHVTINGRAAVVGEGVPEDAQVRLDSRILQPPTTRTYLMLHKPAGYVTSRVQQGTAPTIYALLPERYHYVRPVGRLDRESSGLLLLTDDGAFIQRYTHPSFDKDKIYDLTVARPIDPADLTRLQQGVQLRDGLSRLNIHTAKQRRLTVALHEGRNRQIRRTFGALGYTIERLHRVQVGPYQLGRLPAGGWKTFKPVAVS